MCMGTTPHACRPHPYALRLQPHASRLQPHVQAASASDIVEQGPRATTVRAARRARADRHESRMEGRALVGSGQWAVGSGQ